MAAAGRTDDTCRAAPSRECQRQLLLLGMNIEMTQMGCGPDRDAGFFFAADVFDDDGTRYPARIMIEGISLARINIELNIKHLERATVEKLYRQELEALLRAGQLVAENEQSTVNVVFLIDGETRQTRPGDIVISGVLAKLRALVKQP